MRQKSVFLSFLLAAAWLAPSVSTGEPDPLGERRKPSLERPAAAPAPAPPRRTAAAARAEDEAAQAEPTPDSGEPTAGGAPASGTAQAPAGAGSDDGTYRLGSRDIFRIEVWNRAEIEYEWRPVSVSDRGTVNLPLLDDVSVDGLTINETRKKLTALYDKFIIGPQVFLQMVEYNSRQISVLGEVKNPGRYALKGQASITDVLAEAGDLTKKAASTVRLLREKGGDSPPEVRDIDLDRIKNGDLSANLQVQPGDVLTVLPNRNVVYVTGMVKEEGYVEFEEGLTAQQAVILVGGLADGAAGGRAKVYRVLDGRSQEIPVDVRNQKKVVVLLPGDIIRVPRSIF